MSYNGKVSLGINVDPQLNQDPKELAKHWKSSFEKLYEETMAYPGMIPRNKKARKKVFLVNPPDTGT